MKWKGGPQNFGKKVINPGSAKVAQSIECHIDCFAPGGYGQRHGHMNSAVFYILKGKGHDVHDGRSIEWEAGDAMIVENACVHQHLNDDPEDEAIVLVCKGQAAVPVHAPDFPEDRRLAAERGRNPGPARLPATARLVESSSKYVEIDRSARTCALPWRGGTADFYAEALKASEQFRNEYKGGSMS